jgi:uncharacterized protein (DUF1810 family)
MTDDAHGLQRFVDAQGDGVYERALGELARGQKQSHWMWFVFPQLAGLGGSSMAEVFAIASLDEARAYLAHPVLGPRLTECVATLTGVDGRTAEAIFGFPDVLKFRSCLTLFAHAAADEAVFTAALAKFYDGKWDERSLALLGLG